MAHLLVLLVWMFSFCYATEIKPELIEKGNKVREVCLGGLGRIKKWWEKVSNFGESSKTALNSQWAACGYQPLASSEIDTCAVGASNACPEKCSGEKEDGTPFAACVYQSLSTGKNTCQAIGYPVSPFDDAIRTPVPFFCSRR